MELHDQRKLETFSNIKTAGAKRFSGFGA